MSENPTGGCGCGCGGHSTRPAPPTGRDLGLKAARPGTERAEEHPAATATASGPGTSGGGCGCGGH